MVAASLLERILKGEWQVGQRIPTVDQLEAALPVSRVTICRGIQKLIRQGYLHGVRGSGTYVSSGVLVRRVLLHVGGDQERSSAQPFGRVVTRKVEALLASHGAQVEIHWEAYRPLAGSRLAADLTDGHFSGIISVASNLPVMIAEDLPSLLGRVPMVHVGVHRQVPWICADVAAFHRHAVAWCKARRAQRVLYVARADSPQGADFVRHATGLHLDTLQRADGDLDDGPTEDGGYASFLKAWQRLRGQVDAVIIPDDIVAKGVVQAVMMLGPEVAQRLHLLALTNKDSGIFYPLPVDAIEVDTGEVARLAVALLERQFTHGILTGEEGSIFAPRPVADFSVCSPAAAGAASQT